MEIICDHCGNNQVVSGKKWINKKSIKKSMQQVTCQQCGKKIFYPLLQKYNIFKNEF
jgi:RNase P subunit RPR2